jgi:hypothetical protein
MSQKSSKPYIKFPHLVLMKSLGLLPMLYTVRELAEELSMPERTLRDWLAHGAPHTRDQLGHIWINGQDFAGWVTTQRKKPSSPKLKPGEGFCMSCKQIVKVLRPIQHSSVGRLIYIQGVCPYCSGKINRGVRYDPS